MRRLFYNLTGTERRALVAAMSEALGEDAVYQGAPSFSYLVDGYSISRNGTVFCPQNASRAEIEQLTASLQEQGFTIVPNEAVEKFTVELPRELFSEQAISNLHKIVASKETVLKKAFGTDSLPIQEKNGKLCFPWFTLHNQEGETDAYTRFISAIGQMARLQQRVTAIQQEVTNEKFTMRLFLVRLGLIGDEYKTTRKILLQNLTGNGSWKNGQPPRRCSE